MQHLDTHVLAGNSPEARQATTRPTSIKKSLTAIVETEVSSPSVKRSLSDSFSCMDRLPASHFECQSRSRTPFDETELRSAASGLLSSFQGGDVATFFGDPPRPAPYLHRKAAKSSISGGSPDWCQNACLCRPPWTSPRRPGCGPWQI